MPITLKTIHFSLFRLINRTSKIDFGVIETEPGTDKVIGFREKPEYNFEVSMGVLRDEQEDP